MWEEVKCLLQNPDRLAQEYQRRLLEIENTPLEQKSIALEKQIAKLQQGISRLIDGYTQGKFTNVLGFLGVHRLPLFGKRQAHIKTY